MAKGYGQRWRKPNFRGPESPHSGTVALDRTGNWDMSYRTAFTPTSAGQKETRLGFGSLDSPEPNAGMAKFPKPLVLARPERRRYRRFDLQYPVRLRLQLAGSPGQIEAVSKNAAVGGLLLRAAVTIPQRTPVGFVMTIHGEQVVHPIHLVGDGQVVRVEAEPSGTGFVIAVECTDPITELENNPLDSAR